MNTSKKQNMDNNKSFFAKAKWFLLIVVSNLVLPFKLFKIKLFWKLAFFDMIFFISLFIIGNVSDNIVVEDIGFLFAFLLALLLPILILLIYFITKLFMYASLETNYKFIPMVTRHFVFMLITSIAYLVLLSIMMSFVKAVFLSNVTYALNSIIAGLLFLYIYLSFINFQAKTKGKIFNDLYVSFNESLSFSSFKVIAYDFVFFLSFAALIYLIANLVFLINPSYLEVMDYPVVLIASLLLIIILATNKYIIFSSKGLINNKKLKEQ